MDVLSSRVSYAPRPPVSPFFTAAGVALPSAHENRFCHEPHLVFVFCSGGCSIFRRTFSPSGRVTLLSRTRRLLVQAIVYFTCRWTTECVRAAAAWCEMIAFGCGTSVWS